MSPPAARTESPCNPIANIPSLDRSTAAANPLLPAVCSLLIASLFCGCASGLMGTPAAGILADRCCGEKKSDAAESAGKSKDKDKKKKKKRDKETDNEFGNTIDTPLLSEYMSVQGNTMIVLRGVGLVTGLNGTGGDPSPSALRTQLQNEMSRRNVKNSKQILASRDTAMVVITAYLPAMVRKGQRFDVRVSLPPNSNAKSLKGGWLLETRLFEEQTVEGKGTLKGHEYAVAGGAILTSLGVKDNRDERQAELMSGSIPGGAVSRTDRDLSIVLRTEKRGYRNSTRIADAVSERFHRYNNFGQRISCAEAKTDAMIALKTHAQYINNFPRYQAVIRSIAFNETDVARRIRMEQLARDILDPEKCQSAALQLEAIGDDGMPFLKDALESDSFEVRFQAAQSLAYLGESVGVSVLSEAVRDQPAFRVYSLVALSVIDDADAVLALRELMSDESIETRYGAFRALKELDAHDPSLNPVSFENRFTMHVIESSGQPMVHVTRRRAPEVVLFGAGQALKLPAILNAGRSIRVIGESGSNEVDVIFYQLNAEPQRQKIQNSLVEIIRACGNLGATYPDIVQMLIEAEQQHNFMGTFGIDRLPQAGRLYLTDGDSHGSSDTSQEDGKRIGSAKMLPELFDELDEDELREHESEEKLMSLNFDDVDRVDQKATPPAGTAIPESEESATQKNDSSDSLNPDSDRSDASVDQRSSDSTQSADDATYPAETAELSREQSTSGASSAESDPEESDAAATAEADVNEKPGFRKRWWNSVRRPFGGLEEPEP